VTTYSEKDFPASYPEKKQYESDTREIRKCL